MREPRLGLEAAPRKETPVGERPRRQDGREDPSFPGRPWLSPQCLPQR